MNSYRYRKLLFQDIYKNIKALKNQEKLVFLSYIIIMTANLEEIGLSSIVDQFDLFFIDIWGVVHNGIKLYPDAINVLERLNDKNKD